MINRLTNSDYIFWMPKHQTPIKDVWDFTLAKKIKELCIICGDQWPMCEGEEGWSGHLLSITNHHLE